MTCEINCMDHPGSVDKINWKCVECETNLEAACKAEIKDKAEVYQARIAEQEANKPGISQAEIDKRRRLAE